MTYSSPSRSLSRWFAPDVSHKRLRRCLLGLTAMGAVLLAMFSVLANDRSADGAAPLIVHEWGTFTELQNDAGTSLGGINTDDEPVPSFVHRVSHGLLAQTYNIPHDFRLLLSKGVPLNYTRATMRMETPVVYFYPPNTQETPLTADVSVAFRGGWISEYYPNAEADAPGLKKMDLSPATVGTIRWRELQVGAKGIIPETDDPVWTTPRLPQSARLVTAEGEAENYLFYRGIGNFSGPLRVTTDHDKQRLRIEMRSEELAAEQPEPIQGMWLVETLPNGTLAYRRVEPSVAESAELSIAETNRQFAAGDFSAENKPLLHTDMHQSLCRAGLYPAEATAMLGTWDRAYFQAPGLRLFYLAPRSWVESRLPLSVTVEDQKASVEISRVMIGRIELISDRQRELIVWLKSHEPNDASWTRDIPDSPARDEFYRGQSDFGDLGVEIPKYYQNYLALGRFRNALLRHELSTAPSDHLVKFAQEHSLQVAPK